MGLETFTPDSTPDILDTSWPAAEDPLNKGDDHLRLIKTVVKNFWEKFYDSGSGLASTAIIPPAVNSADAGSGFGGFRYEVVTESDSTKTLKLYTS